MISSPLHHKEGITLSGLPFWIGLIWIVGSILLYVSKETNNLTTFLLVAIGTIPLLSIKGVRFDFEAKTASKYVDFLLFKWKYQIMNLEKMETIELRLFSENQKMNMLSISTTVRTRVYELYLTESGKTRLL